MAKIKIVGVSNESYPNKNSGEIVEQVRVYYVKDVDQTDKMVGQVAGSEMITSRRLPAAVDKLFKLGEDAIGMNAQMSKDTSEFNGKSYSYVDSFDILDKEE